jgi:thiosulfate/3-mercaptopyruvate sulfurtransferase
MLKNEPEKFLQYGPLQGVTKKVLKWNFLIETMDPDAVYLDCRSEEQYNLSSIRGAHGAAFIKKPFGSGPNSVMTLSNFLRSVKSIVKDGNQVVVFDEGEGMYASRMLWLLYGIGISQAKLLAIRFVDIAPEMLGEGAGQITAASETKSIEIKGTIPVSYVQKNLTKMQILDVRMPEEYQGSLPRMVNPEIGSVCGRIPGSINWDWRRLYGLDGHLKSKVEMISDIRSIGLIQERPTMIYDFNGARSCTTALVLTRCGYRDVNVYLGSWMEWRKTDLPKQNVRIWRGD